MVHVVFEPELFQVHSALVNYGKATLLSVMLEKAAFRELKASSSAVFGCTSFIEHVVFVTYFISLKLNC